jgi:trigger factor
MTTSELQVKVESPSAIVRKLHIKVPASVVSSRFNRGLAEVQKDAKLKGFRPGQAPLAIIKQYYGEDVRHRVYHSLIDETFQEAVRNNKLMAVGRPTIESPEHQHGEGAHDHGIHEDKDFTYIATVEILPEIDVKGYTGLSLTREKKDVTGEDVEKVVQGMLDQQAEIIPAAGGLADASGNVSSRPAKKGDFVDMNFSGGIVTESGKIEEKEGMKGTRLLEIGSNSLIPGFEEELIGLRKGETKTFRLPFPKDFFEKELAGKDSEFTVTINEVKEKKLPELNDEFVKQMGYDSVADFKTKAKEFLVKEREEESERKIRADLITALVEKNPFDVPQALVESQVRALAQDWAEDLRRQGIDDKTIQNAITAELGNLQTRAMGQVRGSLLLEAVAKKEKIEVSPADFDVELKKNAEQMKADETKLREFYDKNPARYEDFVFRLRQDRTVKFLLDSAKIKSKS